MAKLLSPRASWAVLRAGHVRARVGALRDGLGGLRLAMAAAAVTTGLLDALAGGPVTTGELARRLGATDGELLAAWVRTAVAAGLVEAVPAPGADGGAGPGECGTWRLTRRGRAVHGDDFARAQYEAFAGFHTGLYRDLAGTLGGGPRRRDVAEQGELIARVSAGFEPFVLGELTSVAQSVGPRRVLDIGCGAGVNLATMVAAVPDAEGVGLDVDAPSVELAAATLARWGVADRARVLHADVREATRDRSGAMLEPFGLALLANVLYYLPEAERVPLLRAVAGLLVPGGRLLVVTTVAEDSVFSRHFDLLLRAQDGEMRLSDAAALLDQLRTAGLGEVGLRRLVPGQPLVVATGTAPA